MDDGSLDWWQAPAEPESDARHRSLGRTEAFLECLELLRAVWVQLPGKRVLAGFEGTVRQDALESGLASARAEMLRRMGELRDSIEREAELRRRIDRR